MIHGNENSFFANFDLIFYGFLWLVKNAQLYVWMIVSMIWKNKRSFWIKNQAEAISFFFLSNQNAAR